MNKIRNNRLFPGSTKQVLGSSGKGSKLSLIGVVGFLTLWAVISTSGLVNPLLLPSPLRVLQAVGDVGIDLIYHVLATIARVIVGLLLGAVTGIVVGVVMQYSKKMYVILDGLIETFRPIPPVALVPFFILVFGFAEIGKLLLVMLGVSLLMVVTTIEAINRVPTGILRWGLVSGLPRISLFLKVLIPAAWPEMRGGSRISLALAITLVIVSEYMGARYGLGYLINVSKITLTTPTILLSIIIVGWVGWTLDRLIRLIFDKTCAWDIRAQGAIR